MHGDTVVTKDQAGEKKPLNKDKSNLPPKMNKGVELLLRNKRRRVTPPKTFHVKFGNMLSFFNREIHLYFEFHLDFKKKTSLRGGK